jgi:general secretion pathway protein J
VQLSHAHIRRPAPGGFTLLEILVAVMILGVVVTTVLASFNMVFSTTDTLERSAAVFEMGKNSLNRITADLENIVVVDRPFYKPPGLDDPPDPSRVVCTAENTSGTRIAVFRFTSRAHVPVEKPVREGIAEIVYYVQPQEGGGFLLRRADHLYPYPKFDETAADPLLCENVKSLAFTFFDEEGTDYERWNSDAEEFGYATPAEVAVRLEIGTDEDAAVFQTRIRLPMVRRKSG